MKTDVTLLLLRGQEILRLRGQSDSTILMAKGRDGGLTARSVRKAIQIAPQLERHESLEAAMESPPKQTGSLVLEWVGAENSYWPFRHPDEPTDIPARHAEVIHIRETALHRVTKEVAEQLSGGLLTWDAIFKAAVAGSVLLIGVIAGNLYFGG